MHQSDKKELAKPQLLSESSSKHHKHVRVISIVYAFDATIIDIC